jgi:hypothetical protein
MFIKDGAGGVEPRAQSLQSARGQYRAKVRFGHMERQRGLRLKSWYVELTSIRQPAPALWLALI